MSSLRIQPRGRDEVAWSDVSNSGLTEIYRFRKDYLGSPQMNTLLEYAPQSNPEADDEGSFCWWSSYERSDARRKCDAGRAGRSTNVRCEKGWCGGDSTQSFNDGRLVSPRLWRRYRPKRLQTRTNSAISTFPLADEVLEEQSLLLTTSAAYGCRSYYAKYIGPA